MKLRKMMAVIGGLALASWLGVPAIRIWRDPGLRTHRHSILGQASNPRITLGFGAPASRRASRVTANSFYFEHQAPFWDRYRASLLGRSWPDGDRCRAWDEIQVRILPPGWKMPDNVATDLEADAIYIKH